jgi:tRNA dimethylallyltransferase
VAFIFNREELGRNHGSDDLHSLPRSAVSTALPSRSSSRGGDSRLAQPTGVETAAATSYDGLALGQIGGGAHPLIAIVGPTAAGKSSLALTLAERLNGEVVNYDSVQLYRGVDVGSGKLPAAERRGIAHHLLDCLDPAEVFTAGDYRREALKVLADLRVRAKLPVFAGGTGLYLRALLLGLFEGPRRSEPLRERLRALVVRRSQEFLHRLLLRLDAVAAARIEPRDTQKVIRAVEVCVLAKQPISAMHASGRAGLEEYQAIKIGLHPPRALLYDRINRRVQSMFATGLMDETQALLDLSDTARIKPLGALGYRQARAVLQGHLSPGEAVIASQTATRQYAKRQLTWFRREKDIFWFEGFGDDPLVQGRILGVLGRTGVALRQQASDPSAVSRHGNCHFRATLENCLILKKREKTWISNLKTFRTAF